MLLQNDPSPMVRDAYLPPKLAFLVKFIEPDLDAGEIATEAEYLHQDLQALAGLAQTRFSFLNDSRGELHFRAGVRFEAPPDRLRAILRRLCDRLDDRPLETLVLIQQGVIKLQIQTHQAEELAGIVIAAESLLPPERLYLAKAETYSRTWGELSPAEEANLDLLRQRLMLSKEEAEELKAQAMGPFKTLAEKSSTLNRYWWWS
ncbi:MAG: hypothetical protein HC922_05275 [Leptolyngbyaceae cyanobacterium SM2_3_12]|nr:hypothetical protein [Leptolyngbyaceae cyanobacterium SM2_3_12]